MPRLDAFMKAAGETVNANDISENSPPTANKSQEEPEKDEDSKSKIDFNLYLRDAKYTLNDVILSETTKHQVDLILAEIEYQDLIYQEWGMAEKHKLDKALSVKYVGETPKNIRGAFDFATQNNAVLFFDEADSFLGKRLENVTQSTDTAVNLTRSVMIKQLSAYEGVVIFATNLIRNYDAAFISRIRWKVQFDLPNEGAREKIWEAQIPSKLPLADSVNFAELAKEFDEISGRDIKNAVFQAVVAAAREKKPKEEKRVTQSYLWEAITEIVKANKAASKQQVTLTPVEGDVPLPTPANNLSLDQSASQSS
ncbi:MAG: ATP-binding protein [Oscillatoriales cyanobacterium]|nr:MAG: ATP-binding protein [Oscillatoriales cyanobacterium]